VYLKLSPSWDTVPLVPCVNPVMDNVSPSISVSFNNTSINIVPSSSTDTVSSVASGDLFTSDTLIVIVSVSVNSPSVTLNVISYVPT